MKIRVKVECEATVRGWKVEHKGDFVSGIVVPIFAAIIPLLAKIWLGI